MAKKKITLATYFTISRFFLVPVFMYLFLISRHVEAIIVLIVAGLTDAIDGFLARRFNIRNRLGSMLDPLADKFLMLVSYLGLAWQGHIPWPLTALVIGRDFLILLGAFILSIFLKIKLYFKPTRLSKITTISQIMVLALSFLNVLLGRRPVIFIGSFNEVMIKLQSIFISVAIVLTIITSGQYAYIAYKFYRYGERRD